MSKRAGIHEQERSDLRECLYGLPATCLGFACRFGEQDIKKRMKLL